MPAKPTSRARTNGHGRIRIIGGTHRGRLVDVPRAAGLRPTPDRVRETLFNWLGQDLTGAATLEVYAGTGVLTLEARSRGAVVSVAVDRDAAVIAALLRTAGKLGLGAIETHAADALAHLEGESRRFDVIFADPPYADDPWAALLPLAAARLASRGFVFAEAGRRLDPPAALELVRYARAGAVHYHLLAAHRR